jgi:hypothetical protein
MAATPETIVSEKDKPYTLALIAVGSEIAALVVALFYLRDVEAAKFIVTALGPQAGMAFGYYLGSK